MNRCRQYCLRNVVFVACMLGLAGLSACDDSGGVSSQEYIDRAAKHSAQGNFRASIIEIKNAVKSDPKNSTARALLGRAYVEVGDVLSAEKELQIARDLGADVSEWVEPLGRAWLILRKYELVLKDIPSDLDAGSAVAATALSLRGEAHRAQGRMKEAQQNFKSALSHDPNHVRAFLGLARIALANADTDVAEAALAAAVAVAPNDPAVLFAKGDILLALRKFNEAESAYAKLVEARSSNLNYRLPLAQAMIANGRNEESIKHLVRVLKVAPKHPAANYLRALAAYRLQQYQEAKVYSQQVLAVAPGHLASQLLAGATSYALEEFELANNYLTKFLAQAPSHEAAQRLHGATLMRLGRTSQALAVLKPLTDGSVGDPQLLAMVGNAALRSGDYESGRKYFKRFVALLPDNAAVHERLGALELGVGNFEQGIEELERALELDPKSNRVLITLFLTQIRAKRFDDAMATAVRVQESRPDSPVGHTFAGVAFMGKQDTAGARAAFEKALKIKPGTPDASANLAALELREKKPARARELLMETLNRNPGHFRTLIHLAQLEDQIGDRRQTRNWLEKAVEADPNSVDARTLLARIHIREGRLRDALNVTREAIQTQPKNVALLTVVGQAQLIGGQARDAAGTLRRLVAEQPKDANSHFLLALAYGGMEEWTRQEEELKATITLNAKHLRAKVELAELALRGRDFDAAQKLVNELKAAAPKDSRVVAFDARLALTQGRYVDSIRLFRQAMLQQTTTLWMLGLADAQWRSGDRDGSLSTLEDWLSKAPQDLRVRLALANRYLAVERYGPAKDGFEKVVAATPDNWSARNNLAWLLWRTGDARSALPHAERALDRVPDNAGVQDTIGIILLDLDRTEQAVRILRRAAEGAPKDKGIKVHLAQALAKQGETEQARGVLREALAGDEDFSDRENAEALLRKLGG